MKRLIILLIGLFFIVSCCSVRPGKLTGKWFRSTTCVDDARTPGSVSYTHLMAAERFSNHYCTDLHEPQNNFTVFLVFNISIHPSKFVFAAIFVLFSKQGWLE